MVPRDDEATLVPNLSPVLSGHGESFNFYIVLLSPNFLYILFWLSLHSPVPSHLITSLALMEVFSHTSPSLSFLSPALILKGPLHFQTPFFALPTRFGLLCLNTLSARVLCFWVPKPGEEWESISQTLVISLRAWKEWGLSPPGLNVLNSIETKVT